MFYFIRNGKLTKVSIVVHCALFLFTYMYVFGLDVTTAAAQEKFGSAKPSTISPNFGTPTYTSNTYNGLSSYTTSGGNYNTTYSNYNSNSNFVNPQFGNSGNLQPAQYTGVVGFIRGLFTGNNNNYTTTSTANYGYTGVNYGTNNYGYTYTTPYTNSYYSTTNALNGNTTNFGTALPTTSTYNSTYNTTGVVNGVSSTYSNAGRVYGQSVGGAVGAFLGGTMDVVSFVGGKIVYGGTRVLNGLANATGNIGTGIGYASSGLVGTMGNVLGLGGRIILGAAKVALTIPILALKAGIYLTALATVGTVRLLGAGLNILKSIVGTSAAGVNTLGNNLNNLYTQAGVLGTTGTVTYNNNCQQFGQNVNNTYTYANTLQQNMVTNQGIANSVSLSAQKIKNDMSINANLAGLTLVEVGKKLAYATASLVCGSASQTSLVLGQTIQNIEYTKAQLKQIKAMNDSGMVNPLLCKQYIADAKLKLDQANALLKGANQSINNSYFNTLTNIQNSRAYITQNNAMITNQMNTYGTSNIYQQTIPYNTLNTYNSNVNYLNNTYSSYNPVTYATVPQATTNFANSSVTSNTTGTVSANTGMLFFDQTQSSERQNAPAETSAAPASTDLRTLQEKYTAAYKKYIELAAAGDDKASAANAALEEYRKAYLDFQNALEITQNREASRK